MADYSKFSIKRFRERKLNWIVAPLPVAAVGGGISTGTNLQEVVSMSLHELLGRARGEIARPEGMGIAGVREEIVFFGSPGVVGIVQGFQVAGRRWVEHVNVATIALSVVHISGQGKNISMQGYSSEGTLVIDKYGLIKNFLWTLYSTNCQALTARNMNDRPVHIRCLTWSNCPCGYPFRNS